MDNTVNVEELKKAPIASSCFMGLGQILYLKQYIRGALFAIVEIVNNHHHPKKRRTFL